MPPRHQPEVRTHAKVPCIAGASTRRKCHRADVQTMKAISDLCFDMQVYGVKTRSFMRSRVAIHSCITC